MLYSTKFEEKSIAKVQGVSLPISLKQSVEICKFIRNRPYKQAVRFLEGVGTKSVVVPYTRFNRGGTGHKPGISSGRYPIKASTYILKLLKSAHANARQKALNTESLIVKAAIAKQGPKVYRYGRKRGRTAKRTHVELVLLETKKEAKPKPVTKSPTKKTEASKK